jgi:hypothetical protein
MKIIIFLQGGHLDFGALQQHPNLNELIIFFTFKLVPELVLVILLIRFTIPCILYGTLLIPDQHVLI